MHLPLSNRGRRARFSLPVVVAWTLLSAISAAGHGAQAQSSSPSQAPETAPPSHGDRPANSPSVPVQPIGPAAGPRGSGGSGGAAGPQPFGANLFTGHFAAQREDGQNPTYQILPGDRIAVNAWGAVEINGVFPVDSAGNIFLPGIGPVALVGVQNSALNAAVTEAISRVYRRNYEIYTHLLTASPVAVFVTGGVKRPGRYAGIPSDSILFYLDQAGGIAPRAGSYRRISVIREGERVAELDLYDFLIRGTLPTPQFVDGDTILVERRGPVIEMRGTTHGTVLIELADEEDTGEELVQIVPGELRTNEVTVLGSRDGEPFLRTLDLEEFRQIGLRTGDIVSFREEGRPGHIVVHLEGEFLGSSTLSLRRGSRLVDVLNYVAVDPELANTGAVFLRRQRVALQQRRSLNETLDRLERSTLLAMSDSAGEASIRAQEARLLEQFIQRARQVQPLGRVVTSHHGRQMNVRLVDGDEIIIPPRTNVVRVSGEVQMMQAVMYDPNLTVRDYIVRAGGYTNRAETGAVIVMRQNAGVVIGENDMPIYPGDEIMVPPRIDNKVFQNAIDISSVIYQIAVAASVILRF